MHTLATSILTLENKQTTSCILDLRVSHMHKSQCEYVKLKLKTTFRLLCGTEIGFPHDSSTRLPILAPPKLAITPAKQMNMI